MHIDICVCTFRRTSIIEALQSLDAQIVPAGISLAIIVADNDDTPSARDQVLAAAEDMTLPVKYIHAPARNISIARNACLDAAQGDWIAFLDDDEIAPPEWLGQLYKVAQDGPFDAVFGPAIAEYTDTTPTWISKRDYHSNWPKSRGGVVQTGHTCNVLLRRNGLAISGQRFLLEKGRTGGEDTEFFYRIWRAGATLGIADKAVVYEPALADRLSFRWLAKRKFRSGISYGLHSQSTVIARVQRSLASGIICIAFACIGLITLPFPTQRNYWVLRAVFHAGICAAAFRVKEQQLYGSD